MSRMRDLLALSDLKRWNVVPTSRDQMVSQHCFRVAVISREIFFGWMQNNTSIESIFEDDSDAKIAMLEILEYSMDHDGPECLTGDLPSAFKNSIPDHQLALTERTLCPWYGSASEVSELTKMIVGIAEAIESSAWLSVFGLTGTEPLVSDLRTKMYGRCDRAELKYQGLGAAGRAVASEVWKNTFPLILRKGE